MGAAGLLVSTVGMDPVSGIIRFNFGVIGLGEGIGMIPVAMGLFGLAEVLENLEEETEVEMAKASFLGLFPTMKDWIESRWAIVRGTIVGFVLGMLPGGSTALPTFIIYGIEKRISKRPEEFGTGVVEGVAAPSAACEAATGAAMVPLLTLGIPANVAMAVLLGAFVLHGIQPGPLLMGKHPQLFWGVISSMYVSNVMLLIMNVPFIGIWVQILRVPYRLLCPLIILFCYIGAYALNSTTNDVLIMVIFGGLGYLMRKYKYQGAPFLLSLILGPMLETSFRQALIVGNPTIFFTKPISASLLGFAFLLLMIKPVMQLFAKPQKVGQATGGK
jgi:putative tricarboxylic transport membrane protein